MSVVISSALIPFLSALAVRVSFVDVPDERKLHGRPVPVVGGVAMAFGALVPVLYWLRGNRVVDAWAIGSVILVATGLVDDFRGLSPKAKFAGQVAAALVMICYGGLKVHTLGMLLPDGVLLPDTVAIPLTVVAIVGVTNAINLADGLDGLAGGICLLTFCVIGYLAYVDGLASLGFVALALGGAISGFLRFNTFPATVFMGDTGSQFLGFSAISVSLQLTQRGSALSPLLPLLLLGLPVMDTLFVFATRLANGRSPFAADRSHLHHRLMAIGLHHSESVLAIYVLQTLLVAAAYFFRFYSDSTILAGYLVFSCSVLYVLTHTAVIGRRLERYGWFDTVLKRRLAKLRDEGTVIRPSFWIFERGLPLLLLCACAIPATVSRTFGCVSLAVAAVMFCIWRRGGLFPVGVLRTVLYLLIPFALHLGESALPSWMTGIPTRIYDATFGVLTLFIVVISKFSRRVKGFHSTPMDFLILFLALFFPWLTSHSPQDHQTGVMAARIIILFFCYEVLLAELRGEVERVALGTMAALLLLGVKGALLP